MMEHWGGGGGQKNCSHLGLFLSYQRWSPSGGGDIAPLHKGGRSEERAFLRVGGGRHEMCCRS